MRWQIRLLRSDESDRPDLWTGSIQSSRALTSSSLQPSSPLLSKPKPLQPKSILAVLIIAFVKTAPNNSFPRLLLRVARASLNKLIFGLVFTRRAENALSCPARKDKRAHLLCNLFSALIYPMSEPDCTAALQRELRAKTRSGSRGQAP